MADGRERQRHRRQAVRAAQKATRQALAELPAHLRTGTVTRPTLRQTREYVALSTFPSITFATTQEGRLVAPRRVRGVARHEVAHHLGAGHPAYRAVTGGLPGLTRQEVPQVVRMQREPVERRVQRAGQAAARGRRTRGQVSSTQGFQTPQLREVAATGTPTQQSQAREKMRRLGRRLRGRVDF